MPESIVRVDSPTSTPVVDMNARVTDVNDPISAHDAANKEYVDHAASVAVIRSFFESNAVSVDMVSISIVTMTQGCLEDIGTKLNAVITALDAQNIVNKVPT